MAFETKNSGKPRQVRGTNAYQYRNRFVLAVFGISGLSWFIFEQLPATKRYVEKINNGYWDRTPEQNYRLEMIKRNLNPDTKELMRKREEMKKSKEDPFNPIKI